MSDSGKAIFPDFGKLVPGFDFLQNLTQQASGAASNGMPKMPNLGSWVAPTLNVEELEKRIQELKAVQFWLDQNATALKATIQALEVQKMTLSALQGMNVNMADMAKAFQMPDVSGKSGAGAMGGMSSGMAAATDLANTMASNMASTMASMTGIAGMGGKVADAGSGGASSSPSTAGGARSSFNPDKPHHHFAGLEVPETGFMRREHEREQARSDDSGTADTAQYGRGNGAERDSGAPGAGSASQDTQGTRDPAAEAAKAGAGMAAVIDPLQWWGALTQQFQTIANSAMQDVSQRTPFEASQTLAQDALRTASKTASDLAESASKRLVQSASTARDLMTGAMNVGEAWPVPAASSSARKGGASRSGGTSRKTAPARAGAMASDDKASSGRGKASAKAAKSASAKGTSGRVSKAVGKAEGKGGRGAPQARGNTAGSAASTGSRGGKARSTAAARKASPRAR